MNRTIVNHYALTDNELISRVTEENLTFICSVIYGRYYEILKDKAYRLTHNVDSAEDIVQDVFLVFMKKQPEWGSIRNLSGWLSSSIYRRFLHLNRSEKQHAAHLDEFALGSAKETSLELKYDEAQIMKVFYSKMESLRDGYKVVFELIEERQFTTVEISARTGLSELTVENYRKRAFRLLKETIKAYVL